MIYINPKIVSLPKKQQRKWIAERKKANPNIDWDEAVNRLNDELNPVSKESKED